MKQLRVLTGRHAGTELLLSPSVYLVGADPGADIVITDWSGPPLHLIIPEDKVEMSSATFTLAGSDAIESLSDFVPRTFAEIALCIGAANAALWPSDMQLIRSMLKPPELAPAHVASVQAEPARGRRMLRAVAIAAAAVGAAFCVVVIDAGRAVPRLPAPSLLARTQKAIARSRVAGIIARADGTGVVVEGIVPSASDEARLTAALDELPRAQLQYRFAAAADIAQSIAEALGAPGLGVRYLSDGEFLVEGRAVHAEALKAAAARIVNDLAPLVRSIQLSVVDLPAPQKSPTGAMLQSAGMEYVQTRDGTKHVSLLSGPAIPVSASGAADWSISKSLTEKE